MKNYKQSPPPSPPPSHLFIHNTIQQSGKYSRRRSNEGNGALYEKNFPHHRKVNFPSKASTPLVCINFILVI
jgi:hypothetical protein